MSSAKHWFTGRFMSPPGWDKVYDFVGDPFIHPIFRPKQREANATYLRVLYMVKMEIRGVCYKIQDQTFITYTSKHFQYRNCSVKICHRKKICAKGRNIMSQEVIYEHTKIFTFTGRNLLSQEEIFTGRNLMSQEVFYCRLVRHFFSQKWTSCQKKKFSVTGKNLLSHEEIYCHKKKFTVTGRNLLSQEEIYCHRLEIHRHRKKFNIKGSIFL